MTTIKADWFRGTGRVGEWGGLKCYHGDYDSTMMAFSVASVKPATQHSDRLLSVSHEKVDIIIVSNERCPILTCPAWVLNRSDTCFFFFFFDHWQKKTSISLHLRKFYQFTNSETKKITVELTVIRLGRLVVSLRTEYQWWSAWQLSILHVSTEKKNTIRSWHVIEKKSAVGLFVFLEGVPRAIDLYK